MICCLLDSFQAGADPAILRGVEWLLSSIAEEWHSLSVCVTDDTRAQQEKHAAEIAATLARVQVRYTRF